MSVKCPKCNIENPTDSEFCKECNVRLISKEEVALHTKTLQTPTRGKIVDVDVGDVIDEKYKLIKELGSGGMGVVYKTEQLKPIKRNVAIKVIKLGMDTREVVSRFETEKQALAVMKHPNISKVIDAGATEMGRPYFVMELVSGIPVTDYCDKHKLSTKERLELFIPVCEAVQHAHLKGVIHRDLKPSNVLVEISEDKPVPKIIDFGIAKATEHRLAEQTLFTERGQLIGTPEYMSPEQAEMSELDVDTRTDIYSLGVMLYELLAGVLPFDPKALRSAGFSEIQRIIREEEPPRASTRLSNLGDSQASIAKQRRADVASLHKQLKGDLDWIIMKAMEKDRTRRYSTASDLIADIIRHLKKEPIIARPPSRIYNIGKFIRRHKFGVSMATLLILAVVIGGIAATIGFVRATRAEQLTRKEAETAQQISGFLVNLFKVSDPSEARGNTITAREILDKGAEEIEGKLKDQPEIQARLMTTIGEVFTDLGLYNKAEPLLEKALKTQRRLLGNEHPDTLATIKHLAYLYFYLDNTKEVESLYFELAETSSRVLGDDHPETLGARGGLATVYWMQGRFDKMEQLILENLETAIRVMGEEHETTMNLMHNLASCYFSQERYNEAEPINVKMLEIKRRVLGRDHPRTIFAMHNLATVYDKLGWYDKAESLYIKTMEFERRILGEHHTSLSKTKRWLGLMYMKQERYVESETLLLDAYHISLSTLGKENDQTKDLIKSLIYLYKICNKPEKAAKYSNLLKKDKFEK